MRADLWLKSEASQRVETRTIEVQAPAPPKVEFKTIVVASEPLRFGMQLDRAQLSEIQWPQDALPHGAFATVDALLAEGSRVVLSPMEANEPVLLAKLSGPNGRASLSNLLTPGMRAVTVKTDEIAGVGGFITPGDRVDIVLTRDAGAIDEVKKNADGAAGSTIATEVVVENAKVLSVGQAADERQTTPQVASSVTIEVTAERSRQDCAGAQHRHAVAAAARLRRGQLGQGRADDDIGFRRDRFRRPWRMRRACHVEAAVKEPEGPKFKTVIVTTGAGTAILPGGGAEQVTNWHRMGPVGDEGNGYGDENNRFWPAGPLAWRDRCGG